MNIVSNVPLWNHSMNELAPGYLVRSWDVFFEKYKIENDVWMDLAWMVMVRGDARMVFI